MEGIYWGRGPRSIATDVEQRSFLLLHPSAKLLDDVGAFSGHMGGQQRFIYSEVPYCFTINQKLLLLSLNENVSICFNKRKILPCNRKVVE